MDGDSKKQKRLGPAPIASFEKSFEDSSSPSMSGIASSSSSEKSKMDSGGGGPDDSNSHNDKAVVRQQPSISVSTPSKKLHDTGSKRPPPLQSVSTGSGDQVVHHPPSATLGLTTPSTPRIDISRASSSSHHEDSRDSSPENVFEQVGTGTLQEAIGLGFREEGALELRSSTEELFFMDPEQKREEQEKMQQGMRCFIRSGMLGRKRNASSSLDAGWNTNTLWPQARKSSPVIFKFDEHQSYLQQHQRKDSASSEVAALLCISGRTSRISSVGSQGSAVSRLSAVSGVSRSPSPHRMLLETSFCGPKPLENVVDGSIISTVEPPTAEVLEQVLLSRKHDPTQAILAEGIKIENSPKKKPLTNGEAKAKSSTEKPTPIAKVSKPTIDTGIRSAPRKGLTALARRDSGKQVIGQTPSGTEYIRINLKPDHMYDDKGVAPHERVVDSATGSTAQKKPVSLSLGRDVASEQRLTPGSSPKPVRHAILSREIGGSRSPSPATVAISRKSSFCSLFKPKDSPDSPRDRSRSRSKSRDRGSTPQSQSGTPNKQKSVLAIFKPKRSGSKSKCSSPIDQDAVSQLDGISQVEFKFKSDTPEPRSRPASRLRYYDTPLDGKSIHIPLHTPPEEKSDRKFAPSQISKEPDPPPPQVSPKEVHPPPSTKSPSGHQGPPAQHPIETVAVIEQAPALPVKAPRPPQIEKIQRIENLDAIHTLPRDLNERERTWSLEVHRHSSQESQETVIMDNSAPTSRRISKPNLADVAEVPLKENGVPPIIPHASVIHQQTSQTPLSQHGDHVTREKRRLLFATRIGSGSQEQIFSTQFSLSKTESLSSQLSEQTSIPDSPAVEGREPLHRSDTVIRRPDDVCVLQQQQQQQQRRKDSLVETKPSSEESKPPSGALQKKDSSEDNKRKSKSTSEEEDKRPVIVMMRKKDSSEDNKRKSKSASEEDDSTNRHSRYIENFDPKKKFHESTRKQTSRNSSDSSIKERDSQTSSKEEPEMSFIPELPVKANKQDPNLALPQPPAERQSLISTDEPGESSESERDSEMDPNRIRRHLPRHIGAIEDHESTGLVSQDSFEDELPYVPTTLPEERAHGVALIPMKERVHMELKTCPVDRPRSTTPMNPACLEEYCGIVTPDDTENFLIRGEKLRISLPRKDSVRDKTQKTKSPRRISNASGKSWFEFAEQGIRGPTTAAPATTTTPTHPNAERRDSKPDDEPPPPLPPRKPAAGQWINFENIPEKRKPPKRITALPREASQESYKALPPPVQYNYVKPEECQCECHEVERESAGHKSISSVDLLQQGEDLQPLLEPDPHEGIEPSDLTLEYAYGDENQETDNEQPERDLSERRSRSSGHSQDRDSPDQLLPTSSIRDSCRTKRSQDYRRP